MWINITDTKDINLIVEDYDNFHDAIIEKVKFVSGMKVDDSGSIVFGSGIDDFFFKDSKLIMIISSQSNNSKIIFKFEELLDFKYHFSSKLDNILYDATLDYRGYRFHFKTDLFDITAKKLLYKFQDWNLYHKIKATRRSGGFIYTLIWDIPRTLTSKKTKSWKKSGWAVAKSAATSAAFGCAFKVLGRGLKFARSGYKSRTSVIGLAKRMKYTNTVANRMSNPSRYIPKYYVANTIKYGKKAADTGVKGLKKYIY